MLQPLMHKLASQRIVLGSGSPRRKLILENIGLKCEVIPSTFEENLNKTDYEFPYDYVKATAMGKARDLATKLAADERSPDLLICADTVVTLDDQIIEKPHNKDHAFELIKSYCGRSHLVYTGIILLLPRAGFKDLTLPENERFFVERFHEATEVHFAELDDETIRAYIETGEPMDKAGGYGIQAAGGTLISKVNGDYFNVMGFPLHAFAKNLVRLHKEGKFC